ncbi:MAG TPA: asparagine synthase (glutamine-hydrolyzing), partial [Gammaproteobacteria bacterium]|nr:asparagine synthase (glutamine-hydrolyzing) [Gammaproteobacteria bacterium]
MCGLVGFLDPAITANEGRAQALLRAMNDTLHHRGPDNSGLWLDRDVGIALGHRRLSIVDLSPEGHQPMVSASGRYVLAFNGEVYNHRELRREVEKIPPSPPFSKGGMDWRGHSDTEVMLAAFERWGVAQAVTRFTGMFAFVLWDRDARTLHLVRDRLGEKPLYYAWLDGGLAFASELKALTRHPKWRGEIDRDALALYLRHNYVPGPYSIYRGVYKLPPASVLSVPWGGGGNPPRPPFFKGGSAELSAYWSVQAVAERGLADPFRGGEAEAVEELDRLLRVSVKRQMVADVPLGAFLSGGIDSSTVVALMQAQSDRPVRTFSIGFHEAGYNEAQHAKAVAAQLGTDHTELYVSADEAMAVIPRLPELYDEPFADSSQIPTFLVSQLARQHVTVSLSGDGGDELFGGYHRYFWGRALWCRLKWLPRPARSLLARALVSASPAAWDRVYSVLAPALLARLRHGRVGDKLHKLANIVAVGSPEEMYLRLVSHWWQPEAVVLGGREVSTVLTDRGRWAAVSSLEERMMYLDTVSYLPDDILVKVDRAAMGVSLETRVPLLDHALLEFAWRLPLRHKIRGGEGKWVLKQVL